MMESRSVAMVFVEEDFREDPFPRKVEITLTPQKADQECSPLSSELNEKQQEQEYKVYESRCRSVPKSID
jgi:hypothetical protein